MTEYMDVICLCINSKYGEAINLNRTKNMNMAIWLFANSCDMRVSSLFNVMKIAYRFKPLFEIGEHKLESTRSKDTFFNTLNILLGYSISISFSNGTNRLLLFNLSLTLNITTNMKFIVQLLLVLVHR